MAGAALGEFHLARRLFQYHCSDESVQMWHFCDFWPGARLCRRSRPSNMTSRINRPPACRGLFTVAVARLGLGLGIHKLDVGRLVLRRQITSLSPTERGKK